MAVKKSPEVVVEHIADAPTRTGKVRLTISRVTAVKTGKVTFEVTGVYQDGRTYRCGRTNGTVGMVPVAYVAPTEAFARQWANRLFRLI